MELELKRGEVVVIRMGLSCLAAQSGTSDDTFRQIVALDKRLMGLLRAASVKGPSEAAP